mmetsp:Transcript_11766/g.27874  ORF Transcript_11766/g.27874 Transcript_11766/m.27874 type:complete len:112 (-) Transcript_11766:261-596(-)
MCLRNGKGEAQDHAAAARLFRRAAKGHADAQTALGACFAEGKACRRTTTRLLASTASLPTKGMRWRSTVSQFSTPEDGASRVTRMRLLAGCASQPTRATRPRSIASGSPTT